MLEYNFGVMENFGFVIFMEGYLLCGVVMDV